MTKLMKFVQYIHINMYLLDFQRTFDKILWYFGHRIIKKATLKILICINHDKFFASILLAHRTWHSLLVCST